MALISPGLPIVSSFKFHRVKSP